MRLGVHISILRLLSAMAVLCLYAVQAQSQNIIAYQYWYDSDYSSATNVSIAPTTNFELDEALPTTGLSVGFHSLHIQFQDDSLHWSPAMSKMFYKPTDVLPGNTLIEAEYWYDQDHSTAQTIALDGDLTETIQQDLAANLTDGFHQVGFRVKDDQGYWSAPMCRVFYAKQSANPNNIEHYRYWFNDAISSPLSSDVLAPSSPYTLDEALPTGSLPEGLNHIVSIQFRNTNMLWSPILTAEFDKIIGCYGDLNGDFQVDTGDLLNFLGAFGCSLDCSAGDLNFDEIVDSQDLLIFLGLFGSECDF
jgi:hypothetical protein